MKNVPERTPNTILLYEFEFYFDYPKTQIQRLLSIDAICVGYHLSGTNSKSDLAKKKPNFHILVDTNNKVLSSCMNMTTIGSNSSLLTYLSWIGSCRVQEPNEALKSVCSNH